MSNRLAELREPVRRAGERLSSVTRRLVPASPSSGSTKPPVAGWRIIARKELADNLLSVRFLVLVAVLGLAAVVAVSRAAEALRDAASAASEAPAPFLLLFTQSPEQIPSFVGLVGFLGPLVGIAFGFDAVNNERSQGTLARLVSQPVHRDDVINGKFAAGLAAISIALTSIVAVVAGLGILQLGITPGPEEIARLLLYLVLAIIYLGAWMGFALLCSVTLRRAATSALVAIAVWIVLALFGTLLVGLLADAIVPAGEDAPPMQQVENAQLERQLSRISPVTLYEEATAVLLNPHVRSVDIVLASQVDRAVPSTLPLDQSLLVVWPQIVALVSMCVVVFAVAYVLFLRQEVRA